MYNILMTYKYVNDKSQSSIAKHLSRGWLLYCKFITQFAIERIFKNWRTFGKATGKMADCVIHSIQLRLLSSKMRNSPDKYKDYTVKPTGKCLTNVS